MPKQPRLAKQMFNIWTFGCSDRYKSGTKVDRPKSDRVWISDVDCIINNFKSYATKCFLLKISHNPLS